MKFIAAAAACATVASANIFSAETESKFAEFKTTFRKVYESVKHEESALAAFAANLVKAEQRNRLGGATHGVTKFMDLTPEQFKEQYLNYKGSRTNEKRTLQERLPRAALSIDWTNSSTSDFRAVSPVKDQGRCGSCWAFSTTEQVETVYAMTHRVDAPEFATQQVVACDPNSLGCNGGDTVSGWNYLSNFGGIQYARDYPDTSSRGGRTGACEADHSKIVPGTQVDQQLFCLPECFSGNCNKKQSDFEMAKSCITQSPQSICVNAESWQTYIGGVLTDRECGSHGARALDHCVQVVGYDATAPKPYYIVRNSWNTEWGYSGMIHLSLSENTCGILDEMATVSLK